MEKFDNYSSWKWNTKLVFLSLKLAVDLNIKKVSFGWNPFVLGKARVILSFRHGIHLTVV